MSLVLAAGAALSLSLLYLVGPALATKPDPLHKVTICHRTNSVSNPYVDHHGRRGLGRRRRGE